MFVFKRAGERESMWVRESRSRTPSGDIFVMILRFLMTSLEVKGQQIGLLDVFHWILNLWVTRLLAANELSTDSLVLIT